MARVRDIAFIRMNAQFRGILVRRGVWAGLPCVRCASDEPARTAATAAWTRFSASSFSRMLETWVLTVSG